MTKMESRWVRLQKKITALPDWIQFALFIGCLASLLAVDPFPFVDEIISVIFLCLLFSDE